MTTSILTSDNRISVSGAFTTQEMLPLIAAMHNTIANRGYQDIVLDFSNCTIALPGSMLSVVAHVQRYLKDGVDTYLELPVEDKLRRLFLNTNWAHFIDFRRYDESQFRGYAQVPAIKFVDGQSQHNAVNRILDVLLTALSGFDRSHLSSIEWSLNEITDNVINHSESPVGGFVQVTNFAKNAHRLQFAVCDAGIGIPASLRTTHAELREDSEAMDKAIREGFTRDKSVGQGNGLYGSWRITQLSGGKFEIHSGYTQPLFLLHEQDCK